MHHTKPITVAQYGMGPIGAEVARLLLTKPWAKLVEAVDVDPSKTGRDLGDVILLGRETGVRVRETLHGKPDVVVHTTGSTLEEVHGQLRDLLARGCNVISTCEELSFPLHSEIREELNHIAHSQNVTIVGTGINPGFVMDKLPLTVTGVCKELKKIEVVRIQNASTRREPLQRKIGAGMSVDDFRTAAATGRMKLMGLRESLMMIASGLGIEFERISDETVEPILAPSDVTTEFIAVRQGQIAGVHQAISGLGSIEVSLELRMYVGAEKESVDRIVVTGTPNIELEIKGGIHGDRATAALAVNCIPRVTGARPGVLTMDDIPISYR